MKSFTPRNFFFRVDDKFFPFFALEDSKLSSGSLLLYILLFIHARNSGTCSLSLTHLAIFCHCSRRTVQGYLSALTTLGYVQVDTVLGDRHTFRLVLSAHVEALLKKVDIEKTSEPVQILHGGDADFAPLFKEIKEIKNINPLSPKNSLHHAGQSVPSSASREKGFSWQPKNSARAQLLNAPRAEKEAAVGKKFTEEKYAFEKLWAAWPIKKEKFTAQRIFDSLRRTGSLPGMDELLATVEQFKTTDSHWLNGYAPKLANWLKGHCWQDEVFSRPAPGQPGQITPAPDPNLLFQVQAIQEKYANRGAMLSADAPVSSAMHSKQEFKQENYEQFAEVDRVASQLAELWHDKTPALIKAFCRSAFQNIHIVPGEILTRAQEFLAREKTPCSLISWLKKEVSHVSTDTGEPNTISARAREDRVFGLFAGIAGNALEGLLHNYGLRNSQQCWQVEHQFQTVSSLPGRSIEKTFVATRQARLPSVLASIPT